MNANKSNWWIDWEGLIKLPLHDLLSTIKQASKKDLTKLLTATINGSFFIEWLLLTRDTEKYDDLQEILSALECEGIDIYRTGNIHFMPLAYRLIISRQFKFTPGRKVLFERLIQLNDINNLYVSKESFVQNTLAHVAADQRHFEALGILLQHGADPCIKDGRGRDCRELVEIFADGDTNSDFLQLFDALIVEHKLRSQTTSAKQGLKL